MKTLREMIDIVEAAQQTVAEGVEDSFIQKLGSRLQQLGYTLAQEGNAYRWTRNGQFVKLNLALRVGMVGQKAK